MIRLSGMTDMESSQTDLLQKIREVCVMVESFDPVRYSVIQDKNPREIVMLVGNGCKWRKCRFCDYHFDSSQDEDYNFDINRETLSHVTGRFNQLEVINSGSFVDLNTKTMDMIMKICCEKKINKLHFECHWMHKDSVKSFKKMFEDRGITTYIKLGLETFDYDIREKYLFKGIKEKNPAVIAKYFDEINLLQGIEGQTAMSMTYDIEMGLKYFERVCVNVMQENTMPVKPDKKVIEDFKRFVYPRYVSNDRVDILLNNTDFGVGENKNA